jgi:hypothetical protein
MRPVLQVRFAIAPAPQQAWPVAPHALQIVGVPASAPTLSAQLNPMLQVPIPPPAPAAQQA